MSDERARVLFNILGCAFECSITPPSCLVNELNSTFGSTSSRFVSRTTSVGVNAPSATTSSPANSVLCGFCFRLCVARNRSGQSSRHHPSNHTAFERHRRLLAPPRARRTHHAARASLASATRLAPLVSPSSSPPSRLARRRPRASLKNSPRASRRRDARDARRSRVDVSRGRRLSVPWVEPPRFREPTPRALGDIDRETRARERDD